MHAERRIGRRSVSAGALVQGTGNLTVPTGGNSVSDRSVAAHSYAELPRQNRGELAEALRWLDRQAFGWQ
jgi:hypothetical protein